MGKAVRTGEHTGGLRSLLSSARVYEWIQTLLGAQRGRSAFVSEHLKPVPGESVLDIGCGPATLLGYLPEVRYLGFDPSKRYIESARAVFGDRGEFVIGTIGEIDLVERGPYDLVVAQGVLHHVDDETAAALFDLSHRALAPSGRLVTIDPCFSERQSRLARTVIKRDRGRHVRSTDEYEALARAVFDDVHVQERHDLLRIPYTHAIVEASVGEHSTAG